MNMNRLKLTGRRAESLQAAEDPKLVRRRAIIHTLRPLSGGVMLFDVLNDARAMSENPPRLPTEAKGRLDWIHRSLQSVVGCILESAFEKDDEQRLLGPVATLTARLRLPCVHMYDLCSSTLSAEEIENRMHSILSQSLGFVEEHASDLRAVAEAMLAEKEAREHRLRVDAPVADNLPAVELMPDTDRTRTIKVLGVPKTLPSPEAVRLIAELVAKCPLGLLLDDAKELHSNASTFLNKLAKQDADWFAVLDLPNGNRTGYRIRRRGEALQKRNEGAIKPSG
jgi:hypothetical protein